MKSRIIFATAATLISLIMSASSQALVIKGQATYFGIGKGYSAYVDYMYTDEGPILTTADATFNFIHGDANAYDLGSTYHYYYQVENIHDINIVAFSMNINPSAILSAGWIHNVDLDDVATFNHNGIPGDVEVSWLNGPTDPADASFNSSGVAPNLSFDFDRDQNCSLDNREFSTVLFISALTPPTSKFSSMQNGEVFVGSLPTPIIPPSSIPEPLTLILTACSAIALYLRKRVA